MRIMKCPKCGKPTVWKDNPARPFCSERCKLLDFGAWANEEYAVAAEETPSALEELGQTPAAPNEGTGGTRTS